MLLTEEFPLSFIVLGPCVLPPNASVYACLSSGDAASSFHLPGEWLLRQGLRLPVLHAGSSPQDMTGGEVVWAAGFLLPHCLDSTITVWFQLFLLGSCWYHV